MHLSQLPEVDNYKGPVIDYGRGRQQNGRVCVKFYPDKKTCVYKGGQTSFSHPEGGVAQKVSTLKGRTRKVLPYPEGTGAQKVSDLQFSHSVASPLPVINDRSLKEYMCNHVTYFEYYKY